MNAENKEKTSASSALLAVNFLILRGADGLVGAASHHKDVAYVGAVEIVTNGSSHKVHQPVTIHISQRQGIDAQIVASDAASDGLHHLCRLRPVARDNEQLPASR